LRPDSHVFPVIDKIVPYSEHVLLYYFNTFRPKIKGKLVTKDEFEK